jgi:hypothetical protein
LGAFAVLAYSKIKGRVTGVKNIFSRAKVINNAVNWQPVTPLLALLNYPA